MKNRTIAMVGAFALLAACHAAPPPANQAASTTADTVNYQQRIAGLTEPAREGVFLRPINDAGFDCQKIVSSAAHAPISGRPAWVLECEQHNSFVALLDPGGYVQIVPGKPDDAPPAG